VEKLQKHKIDNQDDKGNVGMDHLNPQDFEVRGSIFTALILRNLFKNWA
jgi:hypothetical protein